MTQVEDLPQRIAPDTRQVVLDMHRLISMDNSGLEALRQLHHSLQRQGVGLTLVAVNAQPLSLIQRAGFDTQLGANRVVASWSTLAGGVPPTRQDQARTDA